MKLSTFAKEFGMAYQGKPFTRQYIYLLVKQGRIKVKKDPNSGLMDIPDKVAKAYIRMYTEANAKLESSETEEDA